MDPEPTSNDSADAFFDLLVLPAVAVVGGYGLYRWMTGDTSPVLPLPDLRLAVFGGTETGTAFAAAAAELKTDQQRQDLGVQWLLDGNTPDTLLAWQPVLFTAADHNGTNHTVELRVSPDYLSAGTNDDHLVVPLGLPEAIRVARALGFELPTAAVVDRVYNAANFKYTPAPLPPLSGDGMRVPGYWLKARDLIAAQGTPPQGTLVGGHKKDVVLTPKLLSTSGRLAIYGWHRGPGDPIQPVSLFHGQDYADYSHGIRAVHSTVLVDGKPMAYRDLLRDPVLSRLINKEAPFDPEAIYNAPRPAWNMV